MTVTKRPDGSGQSRTKWAALGVVLVSAAKIAWDIPEEVVTGLLGVMGWFLRDAIK